MPSVYLIGQRTKDRLEDMLGSNIPGGRGGELMGAELPPSIMVKTPSGGIPACSISGSTITCGSATCKFVSPYLDGSTIKCEITDIDVIVANNFNVPISGNAVVHAKLIGNLYFVDTDNCGA